MFKRLFFLAVLAGIGWYCYHSGIFYNLTHNMEPEIGRTCEVNGPVGDGVYLAPDKDTMKWVIDSHMGTANEKAQGRINVANLVKSGELASLSDHTPVEVIASGKLLVLGYHYPLVKVKVTAGDSADTVGWVQREDVTDTPIQQLYQAMRGTRRVEPTTSSESPN